MVELEGSAAPGVWRRRLLRVLAALGVVAIVIGLAAPFLIGRLGGYSERRAVDSPGALSDAARALVARVYDGIDTAQLVDYHTHLGGRGIGTDCWVNPRMLSWWHPTDYVRFKVYLSAAGIEDETADDRVFVDKLLELVDSLPHPGRHFLLAFDHRYDALGRRDLARSEFYVPNEYAAEVVRAHPATFLPCISIHPYRADAVAELERFAQRGVKLVKWLPNAMGIDPLSELCDPFYAKLAEHDIALLTHAGEEQAVEADEDQELGNPLRLRRALDAGVRVIVAHCASSGTGQDLDQPGAERTNFELFLRLMDEPRYEGLVFGEISTVTQINRFPMALAGLLERTDLHGRLVNGTDYPLPAINVLYQTGALADAGFLDPDEREVLNELYQYNPLLFDLALKRTVHAPGSGQRFAPEVFEGKPGLGY